MQRNRTRDADARLLPAGKLVRKAVEELQRQSDLRRELLAARPDRIAAADVAEPDRKSTRLNSSHTVISYAVFCLKKKKHRRRPHALNDSVSALDEGDVDGEEDAFGMRGKLPVGDRRRRKQLNARTRREGSVYGNK